MTWRTRSAPIRPALLSGKAWPSPIPTIAPGNAPSPFPKRTWATSRRHRTISKPRSHRTKTASSSDTAWPRTILAISKRKPICRWLTTRWAGCSSRRAIWPMRSRHFAQRLRSGRAKPKPRPTTARCSATSRSPTSGLATRSSSRAICKTPLASYRDGLTIRQRLAKSEFE